MDQPKKAPRKGGLGRGINSLIPTTTIGDINATAPDKNAVVELDINHVEPNPSQPRKQFDRDKLEELADSIRTFGIIQPIIVNETHAQGFYQIVAGERRYRAARIAGLSTLPVIIKTYPEMEALQIALIENIQRQDLNPIEEALCYKQLEEYFFHKKEDIAKQVGKSRNTIAARINLLELSEPVQKLLMADKISASHGLKLTTLDDEALQLKIATEIADKNLSLRETNDLIEKIKDVNVTETTEDKKPIYKANPFEVIENALKDIWGTKVNIKGKNEKGKIEIEYYSKEELERIIDYMKSAKVN